MRKKVDWRLVANDHSPRCAHVVVDPVRIDPTKGQPPARAHEAFGKLDETDLQCRHQVLQV
jgi:hypothetical protein